MRSSMLPVVGSLLLVGWLSGPIAELDTTAVVLASNDPVHSVSGGGRVDYPDDVGLPADYSEYYGFSARQRPDGSVGGRVSMRWDPPFEVQAHGNITCLNVTGNSAWIGFVLTHSDNPNLPEGTELLVEVQDNGEGNGAGDTISYFIGGAASGCTTLPPGAAGAFHWTHGNVTVR